MVHLKPYICFDRSREIFLHISFASNSVLSRGSMGHFKQETEMM